MADRPLILPGWAVRAVLREIEAPGTGKTQHRVMLKPQPPRNCRLVGIYAPGLTAVFNPAGRDHRGNPDNDVAIPLRFGLKDRLWVREAFRGSPGYDKYAPSTWSHWPVWYEADGAPSHPDDSGRLRPSGQMPRWASRLTLLVTNVRVQRAQDITEEDTRAEGGAYEVAVCRGADEALRNEPSYRGGFANRWAERHGPGAWARNDWVVALTFRPIPRNIDMEA